MSHELTKSEKKIARRLLDKGLDTEYRMALEQAAQVLSKWQQGNVDNKTAYHNIYKKIHEHDKRMSSRYDGLTGSRWLLTIALIYEDGQITEEDIKDLSEETKAVLQVWREFINR